MVFCNANSCDGCGRIFAVGEPVIEVAVQYYYCLDCVAMAVVWGERMVSDVV